MDRMDSKINTLRRDLNKNIRQDLRSVGANSGGDNEVLQKQLRVRVQSLESDLKRRQTSYVRRERELRAQIKQLEGQVSELRASSGELSEPADLKMQQIRKMHQGVLANITMVQGKTAHMLQDQEKDLLRAFRARLFDVQTELEKERLRSDSDETTKWMEKYKKLESEVEWIKNLADRLGQTNKHLVKHNSTLKSQFESQEEDRALLIKQLVLAKKDNSRLRQEYLAMKGRLDEALADENNRGGGTPRAKIPVRKGMQLPSASGRRSASPAQLGKSAGEVEEKYKELLRRQKKLLEAERKHLVKMRAAYTNEVRGRTEIEKFLRKVLEDVRQDVMARRNLADADISDFERVDRERALELLLSQERVISLLYDKTFPPSRATSAHQTPMSPSTAMSRATRTAPSRGSTAVSNDALDAHMSQLQSH